MYIYIYGVLLKPLRMSVMSNLPQSSGQPSVFCKASSLSPSLYLVTYPLKKKKSLSTSTFLPIHLGPPVSQAKPASLERRQGSDMPQSVRESDVCGQRLVFYLASMRWTT